MSETDLKFSKGTRVETLVNKYLPLAGSVGSLTAGTLFMDITVKTGNGWFFLASVTSFFYAVFYYRWVTGASESVIKIRNFKQSRRLD